MRIGSISQGKIKCDSCGRTIPYAERYLIVKETDGVEDDEKGEVRHYCVKCAREKGYTEERQEKANAFSPSSRRQRDCSNPARRLRRRKRSQK